MPQPFRAGLTFLAVGPTGLEAQTASSKNISRTRLQNCRSLGFARDDKREGSASRCIRLLVERTAGPHSTSLRAGSPLRYAPVGMTAWINYFKDGILAGNPF
jgi:hypothetical protein